MNGKRILIVDDNPTNLKLLTDVLTFDGFSVFQATDAEAAQEVIASNEIDLILMDIALPGMDGLTLTRLLKSDEHTRGLVIVALTAFAMVGDEFKAREAGCDGYITKPIDTRQIGTQVATYLEARSGGA